MMVFRNMENRRRSERRKVALPVWIKDARGGERTQTADVSAHGVSVFCAEPRPVRQYVELEVELPESEGIIAVTAMVARCGSIVEETNGHDRSRTLMGLNFFLFDAKSKERWQSFLRSFLIEELPAPMIRSRSNVEDAPAFLIRPRNVHRLWGFFRGELSRAHVRIESSIVKAPGTVVELIVVHPTTGAEWLLDGEVLAVGRRGSQTSLEIGLPGLDPALIEAFRAFIVTGHGQIQEEIPLSEESLRAAAGIISPVVVAVDDDENPERFESVVINFDEIDDDEIEEDEDPTLDARTALSPVPVAPPENSPDGPAPRRTSSASRVFAGFFAEAAAAEARGHRARHTTRSPFDVRKVVEDETYSGVIESAPLPPSPPPPPPTAPHPVTRPTVLNSRAPRMPVATPDAVANDSSARMESMEGPHAHFGDPATKPVPGPPPFLPALVTVRTTKAVLDRQIAVSRARLVHQPRDVTASLALSNLLLSRGDQDLIDEAIGIVRKVIAMVPNHPEAHHRLAELFARKGDYRLARDHLGQAKRCGHTVDGDLERLVADGHRANSMMRFR